MYTGLERCYGSPPNLPNRLPDPRNQTRFLQTCLFQIRSHTWFSLLFCFLFKNKPKISGYYKYFSNNEIFINKWKTSLVVEWGHTWKKRVHKMATPLGITKGSSLNLGWGKCGIWLVGQWVPISFCAFVCLIIDYTLRTLDIIILDACLVIVFIWGIGMLIILIDHFAYPHMLAFFAVWLLCSPWLVYSQCCLFFSSWYLDSFYYILSWSPLSMLFIIVRYSSWLSYFLLSLCVDLDDIHVLCMTVCCMTSLISCDCMSCLSMWDTHLSSYP